MELPIESSKNSSNACQICDDQVFKETAKYLEEVFNILTGQPANAGKGGSRTRQHAGAPNWTWLKTYLKTYFKCCGGKITPLPVLQQTAPMRQPNSRPQKPITGNWTGEFAPAPAPEPEQVQAKAPEQSDILNKLGVDLLCELLAIQEPKDRDNFKSTCKTLYNLSKKEQELIKTLQKTKISKPYSPANIIKRMMDLEIHKMYDTEQRSFIKSLDFYIVCSDVLYLVVLYEANVENDFVCDVWKYRKLTDQDGENVETISVTNSNNVIQAWTQDNDPSFGTAKYHLGNKSKINAINEISEQLNKELEETNATKVVLNVLFTHVNVVWRTTPQYIKFINLFIKINNKLTSDKLPVNSNQSQSNPRTEEPNSALLQVSQNPGQFYVMTDEIKKRIEHANSLTDDNERAQAHMEIIKKIRAKNAHPPSRLALPPGPQPQQAGRRTREKVTINGKTRCVYYGPRGGKMIKLNGALVLLSSIKGKYTYSTKI